MNEISKLSGSALLGINGLENKQDMNIDDVAAEFERIFARQMVEQMTKSLFENDQDNRMMKSGGAMYKDHIVDVLSEEMGKQEALGIGGIVREFWNTRVDEKKN